MIRSVLSDWKLPGVGMIEALGSSAHYMLHLVYPTVVASSRDEQVVLYSFTVLKCRENFPKSLNPE